MPNDINFLDRVEARTDMDDGRTAIERLLRNQTNYFTRFARIPLFALECQHCQRKHLWGGIGGLSIPLNCDLIGGGAVNE